MQRQQSRACSCVGVRRWRVVLGRAYPCILSPVRSRVCWGLFRPQSRDGVGTSEF